MATYEAKFRTNYFRVKNEEAFREFMAKVKAGVFPVNVFERTNGEGTKFFGFGSENGSVDAIDGYAIDDDELEDAEAEGVNLQFIDSYEEFLYDKLKEFVAEDDAVIILTVGNEKLRYVTGDAMIITAKEMRCIDLTHQAMDAASKMLGNPEWQTTCEY